MKVFAAFLLAFLVAACGDDGPPQPQATEAAPAATEEAKTASTDKVMEVYKSPTCGCCGAWVDHMKDNGYQVVVHEQQNCNPSRKRPASSRGRAPVIPPLLATTSSKVMCPPATWTVCSPSDPMPKGLPSPACPSAPPAWKWATAKMPMMCCCSMKTAPRSSATIPATDPPVGATLEVRTRAQAR